MNSIDISSPEAFKESVLDVIKYTPHTLAQELMLALNASGVDEGVMKSIWCFSELEDGKPLAHCKFSVAPLAEKEWDKRIAVCLVVLERKGFHVEHLTAGDPCRDLTQHLIRIRCEPRPV